MFKTYNSNMTTHEFVDELIKASNNKDAVFVINGIDKIEFNGAIDDFISKYNLLNIEQKRSVDFTFPINLKAIDAVKYLRNKI